METKTQTSLSARKEVDEESCERECSVVGSMKQNRQGYSSIQRNNSSPASPPDAMDLVNLYPASQGFNTQQSPSPSRHQQYYNGQQFAKDQQDQQQTHLKQQKGYHEPSHLSEALRQHDLLSPQSSISSPGSAHSYGVAMQDQRQPKQPIHHTYQQQQQLDMSRNVAKVSPVQPYGQAISPYGPTSYTPPPSNNPTSPVKASPANSVNEPATSLSSGSSVKLSPEEIQRRRINMASEYYKRQREEAQRKEQMRILEQQQKQIEAERERQMILERQRQMLKEQKLQKQNPTMVNYNVPVNSAALPNQQPAPNHGMPMQSTSQINSYGLPPNEASLYTSVPSQSQMIRPMTSQQTEMLPQQQTHQYHPAMPPASQTRNQQRGNFTSPVNLRSSPGSVPSSNTIDLGALVESTIASASNSRPSSSKEFRQQWITVAHDLQVLLLDFGDFSLLIPSTLNTKTFKDTSAQVEVERKQLSNGQLISFLRFRLKSPHLEITAPVLQDRNMGARVLRQNSPCVFTGQVLRRHSPTLSGQGNPQMQRPPQSHQLEGQYVVSSPGFPIPGGTTSYSPVQPVASTTTMLTFQPTIGASQMSQPFPRVSTTSNHTQDSVQQPASYLQQPHVFQQTSCAISNQTFSTSSMPSTPTSVLSEASSKDTSEKASVSTPNEDDKSEESRQPVCAGDVDCIYKALKPEEITKMTQCRYCNKKFKFVSQLLVHMKKHVDNVSSVAEMSLKTWLPDRRLKCHLKGCKKKTSYTLDYATHMDSHKINGLLCDFCRCDVSSPEEFSSHLEIHHQSIIFAEGTPRSTDNMSSKSNEKARDVNPEVPSTKSKKEAERSSSQMETSSTSDKVRTEQNRLGQETLRDNRASQDYFSGLFSSEDELDQAKEQFVNHEKSSNSTENASVAKQTSIHTDKFDDNDLMRNMPIIFEQELFENFGNQSEASEKSSKQEESFAKPNSVFLHNDNANESNRIALNVENTSREKEKGSSNPDCRRQSKDGFSGMEFVRFAVESLFDPAESLSSEKDKQTEQDVQSVQNGHENQISKAAEQDQVRNDDKERNSSHTNNDVPAETEARSSEGNATVFEKETSPQNEEKLSNEISQASPTQEPAMLTANSDLNSTNAMTPEPQQIQDRSSEAPSYPIKQSENIQLNPTSRRESQLNDDRQGNLESSITNEITEEQYPTKEIFRENKESHEDLTQAVSQKSIEKENKSGKSSNNREAQDTLPIEVNEMSIEPHEKNNDFSIRIEDNLDNSHENLVDEGTIFKTIDEEDAITMQSPQREDTPEIPDGLSSSSSSSIGSPARVDSLGSPRKPASLSAAQTPNCTEKETSKTDQKRARSSLSFSSSSDSSSDSSSSSSSSDAEEDDEGKETEKKEDDVQIEKVSPKPDKVEIVKISDHDSSHGDESDFELKLSDGESEKEDYVFPKTARPKSQYDQNTCPSCGDKFATSLSLKIHMHSKCSSGAPKGQECEICSMRFMSMNSLKMHRLVCMKRLSRTQTVNGNEKDYESSNNKDRARDLPVNEKKVAESNKYSELETFENVTAVIPQGSNGKRVAKLKLTLPKRSEQSFSGEKGLNNRNVNVMPWRKSELSKPKSQHHPKPITDQGKTIKKNQHPNDSSKRIRQINDARAHHHETSFQESEKSSKSQLHGQVSQRTSSKRSESKEKEKPSNRPTFIIPKMVEALEPTRIIDQKYDRVLDVSKGGLKLKLTKQSDGKEQKQSEDKSRSSSLKLVLPKTFSRKSVKTSSPSERFKSQTNPQLRKDNTEPTRPSVPLLSRNIPVFATDGNQPGVQPLKLKISLGTSKDQRTKKNGVFDTKEKKSKSLSHKEKSEEKDSSFPTIPKLVIKTNLSESNHSAKAYSKRIRVCSQEPSKIMNSARLRDVSSLQAHLTCFMCKVVLDPIKVKLLKDDSSELGYNVVRVRKNDFKVMMSNRAKFLRGKRKTPKKIPTARDFKESKIKKIRFSSVESLDNSMSADENDNIPPSKEPQSADKLSKLLDSLAPKSFQKSRVASDSESSVEKKLCKISGQKESVETSGISTDILTALRVVDQVNDSFRVVAPIIEEIFQKVTGGSSIQTQKDSTIEVVKEATDAPATCIRIPILKKSISRSKQTNGIDQDKKKKKTNQSSKRFHMRNTIRNNYPGDTSDSALSSSDEMSRPSKKISFFRKKENLSVKQIRSSKAEVDKDSEKVPPLKINFGLIGEKSHTATSHSSHKLPRVPKLSKNKLEKDFASSKVIAAESSQLKPCPKFKKIQPQEREVQKKRLKTKIHDQGSRIDSPVKSKSGLSSKKDSSTFLGSKSPRKELWLTEPSKRESPSKFVVNNPPFFAKKSTANRSSSPHQSLLSNPPVFAKKSTANGILSTSSSSSHCPTQSPPVFARKSMATTPKEISPEKKTIASSSSASSTSSVCSSQSPPAPVFTKKSVLSNPSVSTLESSDRSSSISTVSNSTPVFARKTSQSHSLPSDNPSSSESGNIYPDIDDLLDEQIKVLESKRRTSFIDNLEDQEKPDKHSFLLVSMCDDREVDNIKDARNVIKSNSSLHEKESELIQADDFERRRDDNLKRRSPIGRNEEPRSKRLRRSLSKYRLTPPPDDCIIVKSVLNEMISKTMSQEPEEDDILEKDRSFSDKNDSPEQTVEFSQRYSTVAFEENLSVFVEDEFVDELL